MMWDKTLIGFQELVQNFSTGSAQLLEYLQLKPNIFSKLNRNFSGLIRPSLPSQGKSSQEWTYFGSSHTSLSLPGVKWDRISPPAPVLGFWILICKKITSSASNPNVQLVIIHSCNFPHGWEIVAQTGANNVHWTQQTVPCDSALHSNQSLLDLSHRTIIPPTGLPHRFSPWDLHFKRSLSTTFFLLRWQPLPNHCHHCNFNLHFHHIRRQLKQQRCTSMPRSCHVMSSYQM